MGGLATGRITVVAARARQLPRRHDHLCVQLREKLPEWTFEPAMGGQTLGVRLPRGDAASYAQAALRHGVAVLPAIAVSDLCGLPTRHM